MTALFDPVGFSVLAVLLAAAAIQDARSNTISNIITYSGMILGLGANLWAADNPGDGALFALWGWLACGGIMVGMYVIANNELGGGDVKLLAMVGAFAGVHDGIQAMLWTFVLGAVLAIALIIWSVGFLNLMKKAAEQARLVVQGRGWVPLEKEDQERLQRHLFLAPAAFLGVLAVRFFTGGNA